MLPAFEDLANHLEDIATPFLVRALGVCISERVRGNVGRGHGGPPGGHWHALPGACVRVCYPQGCVLAGPSRGPATCLPATCLPAWHAGSPTLPRSDTLPATRAVCLPRACVTRVCLHMSHV